jgi:hypothetical protein
MKKIPNEVKRELRALATSLPPMDMTDTEEKVQVRGQALIDSGINKTKTGEIIKPDEKYFIPRKKPVDHFKLLIGIWKKCTTESEAWQKIRTYESQIRHRHNETK